VVKFRELGSSEIHECKCIHLNTPSTEEHYRTQQQSQLRNHIQPLNRTYIDLNLFLARSLLGSLGNFSSLLGLVDGLDDTNSDRLSHIPNGESSERRIISESFNTHWLGGDHLNNSGITRLDKFRILFELLAGSSVDLLEKFGELASDMRGVTIEDRSVSSTNLTWVVQDDDLRSEGVTALGWVVLGVSTNVPSANFFDRDVLDVEPNVVAWKTLYEGFVVHFNGFDFSSNVRRGKSDDHTGFDDTSLNTADGDRANTSNFVDILKGQSERLIGRTGGGFNAVNGFKKSEPFGCTGFSFLLPALEPRHVGGFLNHVLKLVNDQSGHTSPCQPEIGTKGTDLGLYPTFLMKLEVSLTISSYRDSDHLVVSILLMATMSCLTPKV
jgi:hypothetical protein